MVLLTYFANNFDDVSKDFDVVFTSILEARGVEKDDLEAFIFQRVGCDLRSN
jgi:hypothetical protein